MSASSPARVDSIRQRLLNHAKATGEEFQRTLDRYAVERLLYRLSISRHRDDFLLKGAMLFRHWFEQEHRPTRDADFLGFGAPDPARIEAIISELCELELDDGLAFDLASLRVSEIRETAHYHGLRVNLRARLGTAECLIQWDIGFGDAVTPGPEDAKLPTLLDDLPAPWLRIYPRETVFAEKLEVIVMLGMTNSRMKDYFDLFSLVREGQLDPTLLRDAVSATFARRNTPMPDSLPVGLTQAFASDNTKQKQWRAFLERARLKAPGLEEVVAELAGVVAPLLR
ncbi:nucleotidyl transferase AbiEii/AbiGii toxin family protein [Thermomonas hydrothermalis]|uniref:Predicted nucleotidyltransferase component of viral defense system n=1 Tax=Thermomonas hydrothermalis TaxID=213588 RepID=A0A1M4U2P3_9GAMM|nr:nucleotidyl transferase AbiEii/AbiGii toxin family protein [Thermomonas hydrothermalis]MCL6620241.1 nucleotidyl transferase AbiEii/AbiGii toxin family protein [Thermomonas hydrothermalis]SHE50900.1 Predicted nucleotidyltransferase component of viral defense system [Thermomonas hydrothermalis]